MVAATMGPEAEEIGNRIRKVPPVVLNLRPTKTQKNTMKNYIRLYVDKSLMPLADIMLTDVDSEYFDLESIMGQAPDTDDKSILPEIYIKDSTRYTFVDLFQLDGDGIPVNIITPATLTEAKQLAQQAAYQDLESIIYTTLFDNPNAPPVSKNRIINYKMRSLTDDVVGGTIALVYFRLASDDTETTRQQLLDHLVSINVAQDIPSNDNPHFPDYLITLPIHDYQQVRVVIKSTERGWDAS